MPARVVPGQRLVDADGVQVSRAAHLPLAESPARSLLVGVDESSSTLMRHRGPHRGRQTPTPDRSSTGRRSSYSGETARGTGEVGPRTSGEGLHRLRPSGLAELPEGLRRPGRQEPWDPLDPAEEADALEEADAEVLVSLQREAAPETAASLLAGGRNRTRLPTRWGTWTTTGGSTCSGACR